MSTITKIGALLSAARTASSFVSIGAVPGEHDELVVYINVTAVSGALAGLTVTYQSSPDDVTYYDHTSSSAITSTGRYMMRMPTCIGRFGRLSYVMTGTTPSFTFTADVEAKRLGN